MLPDVRPDGRPSDLLLVGTTGVGVSDMADEYDRIQCDTHHCRFHDDADRGLRSVRCVRPLGAMYL